MLSQRQLFLQHVGQTSDMPMMLEIERAEGIYLYDNNGKKYIDLVSGVSVSNLGHRHPAVVDAVKQQLDKYMHLMVYGEYIQSPQVKFADLLSRQIGENFNNVYFVNSGSEANEGALKLAKKYTGRSEIVAFKNAYHGSTQGVFSLYGDAAITRSYRPLLPGIRFLAFNNENDLQQITEKTACVIVEPIQAEAGIVIPENNFLQKLRKRCDQTGALLIFDEVQTGFGRTGSLFAFQTYNAIPDIFTIAKGMGGGMPIGAFVSTKKIMDSLKAHPGLGHITTFGGHPVCAAAAYATLKTLTNENIIEKVEMKGKRFFENLQHKSIHSIHGKGLFLSVELKSEKLLDKFMQKAIEKGLIFDKFLFNLKRFRIAPPLVITDEEIDKACTLILDCLSGQENKM